MGILLASPHQVIVTRFPLILVLAPLFGWAQQNPPVFFESYKSATDSPFVQQPLPGKVDVKADEKVEQLMERFAALKHPKAGYRVQVFLGDRKTAEDSKRAFLLSNPETPAYLSWLAPNWRLRIGDCRTRLEAERLLRDLRATYPGCYIVPDQIEMAPATTARTPFSPPPAR